MISIEMVGTSRAHNIENIRVFFVETIVAYRYPDGICVIAVEGVGMIHIQIMTQLMSSKAHICGRAVVNKRVTPVYAGNTTETAS